jgi:hypothetical protein
VIRTGLRFEFAGEELMHGERSTTAEFGVQSHHERLRFPGLALPHRDDLKPFLAQLVRPLAIPLDVTLELR